MATNVYWLVSVPGGNSSQDKMGAYNNCKAVASQYGSPCHKFDFPTLKVGTLDALMLLSDELDKFDKHADVAIRRIVRSWQSDVQDEDACMDDIMRELKVDSSNNSQVDAQEALIKFTWQEERFPHKGNLPELAQTIHRQICELDDEVKDNLAKFSGIRNQLNAIKRKTGGNLLVKDLNGIVDQRAYVQHSNGDPSKKIIPVFIVVQKQRMEDFMNSYETLTQEVVPCSWKEISSDESYALGRVLHLDCPSLQTYKQKCQDNKFTVREFSYDSQAVDDNKAAKDKLLQEEDAAKSIARDTLKMAFSEVFLCQLHLKAVRVFVESVLWYGLPVNFQSMVVAVNARKEQGLQAAMDKAFADAKGSGQGKGSGDGDSEDRPYLQFAFDLDFLMDW